MCTKLHLACDGCGAETKTESVKKRFVSFNGNQSYGFGRWHAPDIDAAVEKTGWVWSDPYTSCTYCPTCWAKIESGEAA